MKPKITDFVYCDNLLLSLSGIMLIEVTINQWRDATLTCCLSVNWNTSLNNEPPVYSTGGGANQPGGEQARGQISLAQGVNKPGGEQARRRTGKGAKKP